MYNYGTKLHMVCWRDWCGLVNLRKGVYESLNCWSYGTLIHSHSSGMILGVTGDDDIMTLFVHGF